jgi:hypothetical protein
MSVSVTVLEETTRCKSLLAWNHRARTNGTHSPICAWIWGRQWGGLWRQKRSLIATVIPFCNRCIYVTCCWELPFLYILSGVFDKAKSFVFRARKTFVGCSCFSICIKNPDRVPSRNCVIFFGPCCWNWQSRWIVCCGLSSLNKPCFRNW